jgi:hypothetical protein
MSVEELIALKKKKDLQRARAVMFADAINSIEGVSVTADAQQLSTQWVNGEITGDAMVSALIKKHSRSQTVNSNERSVSV